HSLTYFGEKRFCLFKDQFYPRITKLIPDITPLPFAHCQIAIGQAAQVVGYIWLRQTCKLNQFTYGFGSIPQRFYNTEPRRVRESSKKFGLDLERTFFRDVR